MKLKDNICPVCERSSGSMFCCSPQCSWEYARRNWTPEEYKRAVEEYKRAVDFEAECRQERLEFKPLKGEGAR